MRGREGDTNKGRTPQQEREGEWGDKREDITINKKEEEESPHGRLTGFHGRDLADIPRGQVFVEGEGLVEH